MDVIYLEKSHSCRWSLAQKKEIVLRPTTKLKSTKCLWNLLFIYLHSYIITFSVVSFTVIFIISMDQISRNCQHKESVSWVHSKPLYKKGYSLLWTSLKLPSFEQLNWKKNDYHRATFYNIKQLFSISCEVVVTDKLQFLMFADV